MPVSEADIKEIVLEIGDIVRGIGITSKPKEDLTLVDLDSTPVSHIGSYDKILRHLRESFSFVNHAVEVPPGFEVEIGLVSENAAQGYIEIMWSVRLIGKGSGNVPHVIIRRQANLYEILLPSKEPRG